MPDKHEVGGSSPLSPIAGEDLQPKGRKPQELFIELLKHLSELSVLKT